MMFNQLSESVPAWLRVCGICEWFYRDWDGDHCAQGMTEEPRPYKSCDKWHLNWDIEDKEESDV